MKSEGRKQVQFRISLYGEQKSCYEVNFQNRYGKIYFYLRINRNHEQSTLTTVNEHYLSYIVWSDET